MIPYELGLLPIVGAIIALWSCVHSRVIGLGGDYRKVTKQSISIGAAFSASVASGTIILGVPDKVIVHPARYVCIVAAIAFSIGTWLAGIIAVQRLSRKLDRRE